MAVSSLELRRLDRTPDSSEVVLNQHGEVLQAQKLSDSVVVLWTSDQEVDEAVRTVRSIAGEPSIDQIAVVFLIEPNATGDLRGEGPAPELCDLIPELGPNVSSLTVPYERFLFAWSRAPELSRDNKLQTECSVRLFKDDGILLPRLLGAMATDGLQRNVPGFLEALDSLEAAQ